MTQRRIFGIGLGRTGSLTLTRALARLGHPVRHSLGPEHLDAVMAGDVTFLASWPGLANGTGLPWREVDRQYPGTRFILTVRDEDSWAESKRRYLEMEDQHWESFDEYTRRFKRYMRERVFGTMAFEDARWRAVFREHNASVRAHFRSRPSELLVMDIPGGDEWEPLCSFLGVAVPEDAFPSTNSSVSVRDWEDRTARLWLEIGSRVSGAEQFILIDGNVLRSGQRGARPFIERNGSYWGPPKDDRQAVAELERMRADGVRFLALAWNCFWWRSHYPGFIRHLNETATCLLDDDVALIFGW